MVSPPQHPGIPQSLSTLFFSDLPCENQVELLEVKLTKMWGPPHELVPLEFLSLGFVHTQSPVIYQSQFRFSYPCNGSHGRFYSWVSVPLSGVSLCPPLQFRPHLSDGPKTCWFFSLSSFVLVIIAWWLLSLLHARPENFLLNKITIMVKWEKERENE